MFEIGFAVAGNAVDVLSAAVNQLADADLDAPSDTALSEELLALARLQTRLSAQILRRLGVFDARQISFRDGLKTSSWWRHHTHRSPSTAQTDVRLARRLRDDPQTAAALVDGTILPAHAHVIQDALRALPVELASQHRDAIQQALLDQAAADHPLALKGLADEIRAHVDPDGADLDAQHAHERRWLDVSPTYQGMVDIRGMLDAETGAILHAALQPLCRPTGPDDLRKASTRRADALAQLALHSLEHGDLPDNGGTKPHVAITIKAEDLAANRGAATLPNQPDVSLTTRTVRRWLCDASVTRILLTPTGQPLDVGRETRTVPPGLRKAVINRDKHCVFPGCDAPPAWCDTHHLKHWADGGETNLQNLALLCRRHHTYLHQLGNENTLQSPNDNKPDCLADNQQPAWRSRPAAERPDARPPPTAAAT